MSTIKAQTRNSEYVISDKISSWDREMLELSEEFPNKKRDEEMEKLC